MARRNKAQTISLINAALSSGKVPSHLASNAQRVLQLLQKKPRISMLWLSASDPAPVLNKFLGDARLESGLQMPPIRFRQSDEDRIEIQLPDGSKTELPGSDPSSVLHLQPVFLTVYCSAPGLKNYDLMLMKVPGDVATGARAVNWAAGETDIVVWGTDHYTRNEDDIWAQAPERLQDHSYLTFMPMADGRYAPALNEIAADQDRLFHEVSHIEFDELGRIITGDLFKNMSRDLTAAIRAALDQGELMIASLEQAGALEVEEQTPKQEESVEQAPEATPQPALKAVSDTEETVQTESLTTDSSATVKTVEENVAPAATEKPADPTVEDAAEGDSVSTLPVLGDSDVQKLKSCVAQIKDFARKTAIQVESGEGTDDILGDVGDFFFSLNDIANDLETDTPIKSQLINTTGEAADLTQLLLIEDSAEASIEAIDLLQQTKFDLELILLSA